MERIKGGAGLEKQPSRRKQRVWAVQILYIIEISKLTHQEAFDNFLSYEKQAQFAVYTQKLVQGVIADKEQIDAKINAALKNWQLSRIGKVDLCILRLSLYELLAELNIPGAVIVNEAIELAKGFIGHEGASFINGILDKVLTDLKRAH